MDKEGRREKREEEERKRERREIEIEKEGKKKESRDGGRKVLREKKTEGKKEGGGERNEGWFRDPSLNYSYCIWYERRHFGSGGDAYSKIQSWVKTGLGIPITVTREEKKLFLK